MPKRGLRVLTLSLGVLLGAVFSAACAQNADAQNALGNKAPGNKAPGNPVPKADIGLKIQLSSNRISLLEPVGVALTVTTERNYNIRFSGWEAVATQIRRRDSEVWQSYHLFMTLVSSSSTLSFELGPRDVISQYCVVNSEGALSDILHRPGAYEIRPAYSPGRGKDVHLESFFFDVVALPPEEALAASYLEARSLAQYFCVDKYLRADRRGKSNADGTMQFGEAELELQQQFQEFLVQFPDSRYVPWVRLAQLLIAFEQVRAQASLLASLKDYLGLNKPLPADNIPERKAKLIEIYGSPLIEAILAGKPTPLHQRSDLNVLQAQVVALAPTLPPPIESRAWVLAARVATAVSDFDAAAFYLDEALATNQEPTLRDEIRWRKTSNPSSFVRSMPIAYYRQSQGQTSQSFDASVS